MTSANLATTFLPDKKLELVKRIAHKTQDGKLVWQKSPNGAVAHAPGTLRISFVDTPDSPWTPLCTTRWVLFVIRDEVGNTILQVENQSDIMEPGDSPRPEPTHLSPAAAPSPSPTRLGDSLVKAATELHDLVLCQAEKRAIGKVIDLLDKM